jgi:hypothetical protein
VSTLPDVLRIAMADDLGTDNQPDEEEVAATVG